MNLSRPVLLLTACVAIGTTACSTSGDTAALMTESAQACSVSCTAYPAIDGFSYEAGGGSPLLFSGKIATSCACSGVR